jgi:hypothetical protein
MQKQMKLKGRILLNSEMVYSSSMHDGTPFSMAVDQHDVQLNEELTEGNTVDGWLFVIQEGQQADRCSITLPKPTLQFGKQIIVKDLQLMPLNITIESFNPKKSSN